MDDILTRQLRDLDREKLVELILSLYGRDPAINREIAAFANRQAPSKHEQQIRAWIQELTGRRGNPRLPASYYGDPCATSAAGNPDSGLESRTDAGRHALFG